MPKQKRVKIHPVKYRKAVISPKAKLFNRVKKKRVGRKIVRKKKIIKGRDFLVSDKMRTKAIIVPASNSAKIIRREELIYRINLYDKAGTADKI